MKRNKKPSAVKGGLEVLENRRLMSSAVLAGGVLTLQGDSDQNNTFYVQPASGNRVLGYADNNAQTASLSDLHQIVVHTGAGQNTVTVAANAPMAVDVVNPDGSSTQIQPGHTANFGPFNTGPNVTGPASTTPTTTTSQPSAMQTPSTPSTPDTQSTAPTVDPLAPKPVITITDGATLLPNQSVHVEALDSSFGTGEALNSRINWNFGDGGSNHNMMTGFNAAHAYDKPGTYTVTLTIITPDGRTGTTTRQVTVQRDTRASIYVSASGNDNNDGLSAGSAVQSIARVNQLVASNTRIFFQDGDIFTTDGSLNIKGLANVSIGSYGSGAQPIIMYNGPQQYGALINILPGSEGISVTGLTFDSIYTNPLDDSAIPVAIHVEGSNITIRGNTFLDVLEGVDMSAEPRNVLVQDNNAPSLTGLRAYFAWVQGSDITIVGNNVANSTREHIVRVAGASRVEIADNTLSNVSGASWGDNKDTVKGAITIQYGSWAYVIGNTVASGPVTIGPLTINSPGPQSSPTAIFQNLVLEANTLDDAVLFQPGAVNTVVRDNVVHQSGGPAFFVNAQESLYGRQVQNLYILNNTVTDSADTGGFLKLTGGVAQNIVINDNLFYAPKLVIGNDSAIIYVTDTSLQSFTQILDNVWPAPQVYNWAQGGYFYVAASAGVQAGYLTPTAWAATGKTGNDIYTNVSMATSSNSLIDGVIVGSYLLAA